MFQAISKQSTSAACASAIRKAIVSGQLPAGAKLPAERALAERFAVNRLTLRNALSQLVSVGLITVRQGSGYTVADLERACGPDLLPDLLDMAREQGTLLELVRDLLEVRRGLASSLLLRVSEKANEAELLAIEDAIDAFEELVKGSDIELGLFAQADLAIVAVMADAAHSPILRLCLNPVIAAVTALSELHHSMYVDPQDNLAGHRLLLSWLRNPELAPISQIVQALAERDRITLSTLEIGLTSK